MRSDYAVIAMLAVLGFSCGHACAQNYPAKPVRVVVPFPAGGGADIFARLIGRKLGENLGQSFVVDNRAGASGISGSSCSTRWRG